MALKDGISYAFSNQQALLSHSKGDIIRFNKAPSLCQNQELIVQAQSDDHNRQN